MDRGSERRRLVVVSNRLPVTFKKIEGEWQMVPGSGGLVTALSPVLKNRGGVWMGWPGIPEQPDQERISSLLAGQLSTSGYHLHPVLLTPEEVRDFYYGFSNEVIWPLFHDLQTRCRFLPRYWYRYLEVNRKFAQHIKEISRPKDYIWVHDYHLIHLGSYLKELGVNRSIGFFLHIPFPPLDIFLKLPWRDQVLKAMLDYQLIGFQTLRDRRNFLTCVNHLFRGVEVKVQGRGPLVNLRVGEREVLVGSFPISIDFDAFSSGASSKKVADWAWYIHENLPNKQILLGIDRLDYTKGIPERLEAFRDALSRFPELRGKVTLVQVVVPSREEVAEYQELKGEIERLVGEINGQFTGSGWVPIHYLYRHLERDELLAYYRASEIALVTPLKDGMNLVCKEFCACDVDERGVLILSEFAGAAAQLHKHSLVVNPYDIEGMANAIKNAFDMPYQERSRRMRRLREGIRKNNIFKWVNSYLEAAFTKNLDDFPEIEPEEYLPKIEV